MRSLNLPEDFQKGVQMWFKYTWDQQRTLNEGQIFDALPKNLKTDIALSVHIHTLSKVKLFADCEAAFLRDLVLQMRPKIFLPGEYVCRKGDIGKEMYIIKSGYLNVLGGQYGTQVLVTLGEGAVFGEVSLMDGSDNRRTAYVQSKGYANLFVLSKDDLNEVLVYYPNAQQLMKERARELMNKNKPVQPKRSIMELAEPDIIIERPVPVVQPRLLNAVLQVLPADSKSVSLLLGGSRMVVKSQIVKADVELNQESKLGKRSI
jgi:cyclic nucleotide gated channel beta 1